MDISFCKLKTKEVINIYDGKNLGNISDIIIDTCCGKILGIIVPNSKNFFSLFKSGNDIFIPYNRIRKIGKDIILVDIVQQSNCEYNYATQNINQNSNPEQTSIGIQKLINDIENEK